MRPPSFLFTRLDLDARIWDIHYMGKRWELLGRPTVSEMCLDASLLPHHLALCRGERRASYCSLYINSKMMGLTRE